MTHSRRILGYLAIAVAICFIPGVIGLNRILFGQGLGDLLTSSLVAIVYYPAYLALTSVCAAHFRPRHALYPLFMILAAELMSGLPGLAPEEIVGRLVRHLYPDAQIAVLGKSAILVVAGCAAGVSMLHRATLFRLIATITALAQCTVLVLFHLALFIWPFEGMIAAETQLMRELVGRDGVLSAVCDFDGSECFRGTLAGAKVWSPTAFRETGRIRAFLDDTAARDTVLFTWMENPSPDAIDKVGLATAMKHGADDIEIVVRSGTPTRIYDELRSGAGLLIVAFHQVWITFALAILARHGAYSFRGGRWRRDGDR